VPSSMSLAAFLSPRANESIAPKNTKKEVTDSDLENIETLKSAASCDSHLSLKCYIKNLHDTYTAEVICNISNTRDRVSSGYSNTENTRRSAVFLTNFKIFGNVVKHCLECLIYLLNRN